MRRIAPCLAALVCLLAACDDVMSSRPDPCAFGDWVQAYDAQATTLMVYGVRHGGRCLEPRVRLLGVPYSLGANGQGPTTVVDHPYTVYVCQPSGPALQRRFRLRLTHDDTWKPSQTALVAAEWDSIRARDQRGELDRAASMRCPRAG